jgi:hypothetical protein
MLRELERFIAGRKSFARRFSKDASRAPDFLTGLPLENDPEFRKWLIGR